MFSGSIVALITPFKDESIDCEGLSRLCEWHIESGTRGIVVCGSTGEATLLSEHERDVCIKTVIKCVNGRIPVIVGCGSPSTFETSKMVKHAEENGASGVLVVTPYYVKPSQEGIYQHFSSINNCTGLPIVVYNNPGRCGVDIHIETMLRLFDLENVCGLKDSSTDLRRPRQLIRQRRENMCLLSGDDPTSAAYLLMGGHGMISVAANIAPRLTQDIYEAYQAGDLKSMQAQNANLMGLFNLMTVETNPCPAKYGVHVMHGTENTLRLPLLPIKCENELLMVAEIHRLGLMA